MSATNESVNSKLPLFVASDKPTWLGDWNEAMEKIDLAIEDKDARINTLVATVNAQKKRIDALVNRVIALDNGPVI